jgi:hypothetical protein
MRKLLQLLAMMTGLVLLMVIPQWIDMAINLLPKPLPEVIGAGMIMMVAVVSLMVLNRLMKGMSR